MTYSHNKGVLLGGVHIRKVTGHNAKYIVDNKIGKGAVVLLRRSGDVIPFIEKVIRKAKKVDLPTVPYEWDDNEVHFVSIDKDTVPQKANQLAYVMKQLGIDNVGPNLCYALAENGFETVIDLIDARASQLKSLVGPKLASTLPGLVAEAIAECSPVTLMVVSGLFGQGIGNRKLEAVLDVYPDFATLSQKAAANLDAPRGWTSGPFDKLVTALPKFQQFAKDVGRSKASLKYQIDTPSSGKLAGKVFLFTGIRDKSLETAIKDNGGQVATGFSTKVTHVVAADPGSSSSKAASARRAGIPIITLDAAYKMLKGMKIVASFEQTVFD